MENRRKQRVEINVKKSHLEPKLSSGEANGSHIVDMLLGDIRKGFLHQRKVTPPEFNIKRVRKTTLESGGELSRKNSKAGSITSEEDGSGSPMMIRRRLGTADCPDGFTTDSPDITPNGTLRKRRSRITSDENEDNLMDFLRQGSERESDSKDRKSWSGMEGSCSSLDRSWSRRSGRRRRPDLLSAEFLSSDRERPASPMSPRMERKNLNANAGQESPKSPRQWKKKIEDWFQENEKEEVEAKLRGSKRANSRRRREHDVPESDGTDSSRPSSMNLDTLHEAKTDTELLQKRPSFNVDYIEPSTDIERTKNQKDRRNNVGAQAKDKSRWRKSTMNVPNSTEAVEDEDSKRRGRKNNAVPDVPSDTVQNTSPNNTPPLGVIKEQENNEIALRQMELPNLTKMAAIRTDSNSSTDIDKNQGIPTEMWQTILKNQVSNSDEKMKSESEQGTPEPKLINHERRYNSLRDLPSSRTSPTSSIPDEARHRSTASLAKADSEDSDPTRLERMARRSQRYRKFVEATSMGDISASCCKSEGSVNDDATEEVQNIDKQGSAENLEQVENFDRFAAIRRTQRFKHGAKDNERLRQDEDISEESGKEAVSGSIVSSDERVPADRRSRKWGSDISKTDIDKILEDIEQTGYEIQEIGMREDGKEFEGSSNLPTSPPAGVRSPLSDGDDSKPKDKSLKARLSRKLHSLAENIKLAARSNTEIANKASNSQVQTAEEEESPQEADNLQVAAAQPVPLTPEITRQTYKSTANVTTSVNSEPSSKNPLVKCHSLVSEGEVNVNEPENVKEDAMEDETAIKILHKEPSIDSIASSSPVSIPSPSARRHVTRSPDTDGDTEKDEGFEETQSLISDTHSQGTGSNCNYENDATEIQKKDQPKTKITRMTPSKIQDTLKRPIKSKTKSPVIRSNSKNTSVPVVAAYQAMHTPPKRTAPKQPPVKKHVTNLSKPKSPSKNSLQGSNRSLRTSNSSLASDKSKSSVIFRPYGAAGEVSRTSSQGSLSSGSVKSGKRTTSVEKKEVKNEIKKYTKAIKSMTNNIDSSDKSKSTAEKNLDNKKDIRRPILKTQRSNSGQSTKSGSDVARNKVEKSSSFNVAASSAKKVSPVKRASSVRTPIANNPKTVASTGKGKLNEAKTEEIDDTEQSKNASKRTPKNFSFMRATSSSTAKSSTGDPTPIQRVKVKAGNIKSSTVKKVATPKKTSK